MNDAERRKVYEIHLAVCTVMNCNGWNEGAADWLGPFVYGIKDKAEELMDLDLKELNGAQS